MTKFMEEGFRLAMGHQSGSVGRGGRKVADERSVGNLIAPGGILARNHTEARGVGVLVGSGKKVEVKPANLFLTIEHLESPNVRMPYRGVFQFDIANVKKRLRDLEESCKDVVQRKVFLDYVVVHLILFLQQNIFQVGCLPVIDSVGIRRHVCLAYGE